MSRLIKGVLRLAAVLVVLYMMLIIVLYFGQRSLLFFPSHDAQTTRLIAWSKANHTIGYCREVPNARTIWLMMHGNAGQAADRGYVLSHMSDQDSLYVLEYPGYGSREGRPTRKTMNEAASEAYRILRSENPNTPVCVIGESIGSGPACALALEKVAPEKVVLVVPFDSLASVASERFWLFPVRLILRDAWDNVEALKHYAGSLEIFGATGDEVIPIAHARSLARSIPDARLTEITGGHNDWSDNEQVKIAR